MFLPSINLWFVLWAGSYRLLIVLVVLRCKLDDCYCHLFIHFERTSVAYIKFIVLRSFQIKEKEANDDYRSSFRKFSVSARNFNGY